MCTSHFCSDGLDSKSDYDREKGHVAGHENGGKSFARAEYTCRLALKFRGCVVATPAVVAETQATAVRQGRRQKRRPLENVKLYGLTPW